MKTKTTTTYPNYVVAESKISPQFKEIAELLSMQSIEEFFKICKIPRPSGNNTKIQNYLSKWGNDNGFKAWYDESGCVVIDVPATPGYESAPKTVLQAHTDMVCYNHPLYKEYDKNNSPIIPVKHSNGVIDTNNTTSLGADNGMGLATAIVVSNNNQVVHGPLRLLFTYDEETTFEGAWSLSKDILNAKYLINLDSISVGLLVSSSAGALDYDVFKKCRTEKKKDDEIIIEAKIWGPHGGHSGEEVKNNGANTGIIITELLNRITKMKLPYKIGYVQVGSFINVIPTKGVVQLSIKKENALIVNDVWNDVVKDFVETCSDGNDIEYSFSFLHKEVLCCSIEDSKEISKLLAGLPNGIIKKFPNSDFPITSSNIGIISVKDGDVLIKSLLRSSEGNVLNFFADKLTTYCDNSSFDCRIGKEFPAWENNKKNELTDMFLESYKEACNFQGLKINIHSGMEIGCLTKLAPEIIATSIGCDIEGEHTHKEKLYTDTLPHYFASLVYVLDKIAKSNLRKK